MPYVQPLKRLANDILCLKAHLKYGGDIYPANELAGYPYYVPNGTD